MIISAKRPKSVLAQTLTKSSPMPQASSVDEWQPMVQVDAPRLIPSSLQKAPLQRLDGEWVLHTYIGEKIFEDELSLQRNPEGELEGTLSVPGGFTAPVENLKGKDNLRFAFEIEPDEGDGKFRVFYDAEFDSKEDVFVGFARLENGNLIGGFVAERPKEKQA